MEKSNGTEYIWFKDVTWINNRISELITELGWRYNIQVIKYKKEKLKSFDCRYYGCLYYKIHDLESKRAVETWAIWTHGRRCLSLDHEYKHCFSFEYLEDPKDYPQFIVLKAMSRARDINLNVSYQNPKTGEWVDRTGR